MIHLIMFIVFGVVCLSLLLMLTFFEPPTERIQKAQIYFHLVIAAILSTQNAIYYFS